MKLASFLKFSPAGGDYRGGSRLLKNLFQQPASGVRGGSVRLASAQVTVRLPARSLFYDSATRRRRVTAFTKRGKTSAAPPFRLTSQSAVISLS